LEHVSATEEHVGFVDHDPGQPRDKAGAAFKLMKVCKSTGVGFLHDILNGLVVV
jgi:hypothetical protein